ncbi:MAG: hydroxymethylbilane synthase [Planctomycetales bacterium]|nr:hydroxymethylbilane synthase [Planctomycetales bacterium]
MPTPRLRLGTRASPLARWQADWVAGELRKRGVEVELVLIATQGDVKTGPLGQIGGQGLFTKEIQRALLDVQIDLAVHSLKDLPTTNVEGLALAAVPERESIGDAFVCNTAKSLADLPQNARIGTGSLRRRAQLLHQRPDLQMLEIRGNVDTRLRKLDAGDYDALVLAQAGLHRLGLDARIASIIPLSIMLPAVGQGALGIEARADDESTRRILSQLSHEATYQSVIAERALLAALRGGCLAPVGAWGRVENGLLSLDGVVLSGDGREKIASSASGSPSAAADLGCEVAEQLIAQGAERLIASTRATSN